MGGVHPPEMKDITANNPTEKFPIPKMVVLPLSQHTGAPCDPLVKKGDLVKTGQKIADSDKPISAPIHASITGTVIAIEHRYHPLGPRMKSIVIEGSGVDEWIEGINPSLLDKDAPLDVDFSRSAEFKKKIRDAGIVGMGGAAFPTHIKISPPPDKKIDILIINGAECEPYLTSDHRLMLERPRSIIMGTRILMDILGVKETYIAIEANKPDAIKMMERMCGEFSGSDTSGKAGPTQGLIPIRVAVCETRYPEGGEKQLINAITGREVPSGKLPMDAGCLVQNVGTASAIYEAIALNKPMIDRIMTVAGSAISRPKNLLVRLGTSCKEILDYCGYKNADGNAVIMGGPMMGKAQKYLDVPVVKGASGIVCLSKKDVVVLTHRPCLHCGKCVEVCPMGLNPTQLALLAEFREYDDLLKEGLMDCMECGACGYACPARRQLVHWIRVGKMEARRETA